MVGYVYWFESSVNSEGIETISLTIAATSSFESSVNSEGIETRAFRNYFQAMFESSVNSEGIETAFQYISVSACLRAV